LNSLLWPLKDNPLPTHPTIGTTKLNSWGSLIFYWDLCLQISIPLKLPSTKSDQRTKTTWRKTNMNHQHLFIVGKQMQWCHWWEQAFRLHLECKDLGMMTILECWKLWYNHPRDWTVNQVRASKVLHNITIDETNDINDIS
jgi:hypothetical protein